ncbi:unnamed protein product, partial [Strongylus vulgaris]
IFQTLQHSPIGLRLTRLDEELGADLREHGLAGVNVMTYTIEKKLTADELTLNNASKYDYTSVKSNGQNALSIVTHRNFAIQLRHQMIIVYRLDLLGFIRHVSNFVNTNFGSAKPSLSPSFNMRVSLNTDLGIKEGLAQVLK